LSLRRQQKTLTVHGEEKRKNPSRMVLASRTSPV
jgi:hypothetical protein